MASTHTAAAAKKSSSAWYEDVLTGKMTLFAERYTPPIYLDNTDGWGTDTGVDAFWFNVPLTLQEFRERARGSTITSKPLRQNDGELWRPFEPPRPSPPPLHRTCAIL